MSVRIAHLSDLHFGRIDTRVLEGLRSSLDSLAPDTVLISGDLTQRARHREFEAAAEFVQALPFPTLIVPGNHDLSGDNLPERFLDPWRKWRRHFGPELLPELRLPGLHVLGINTARRAGWSLDWSRGRINAAQMAHIERVFQDTADRTLRVLVAHHPFWIPPPQARRGLVGRHATAIDSLQRARVDLILGGHIHREYSRTRAGIIISQAGTSSSTRRIPGHPNSFNLIEGTTAGITLRTLTWETDRFSPGQRVHYRRTDDQAPWTTADDN
ncbi:MAG: metallophosphoesterase family protein [Gammaproteobacteria bacterium]